MVKHHRPTTDSSKIQAFYDYREMLEKEGAKSTPSRLRHRTTTTPPKTIPREEGMDHQQDWLRDPQPEPPGRLQLRLFRALATTVLLGNVAARAGLKKLEWDGTTITNDESARAFLKTTYRPGWEIKG